MGSKKRTLILTVIFWILAGIFVVLMSYFAVPMSIKRAVFPVMAVLAFIFFLLGIVLIVLTLKLKIKGLLKKFLILTGISAAGVLAGSVLHNFLYALAVLTEHITLLHYLFEFLHAAFFIIAVLLCPIGFLVGAIGGIVLFIKKKS